MKGTKYTFVNFAGIDYWYHNRAHAEVQLMKRLAKDHTVLFVNSIGMRTPTKSTTPQPGKRILRKIKSTLKYIRRPDTDLNNFYVISPIILPFYSSPMLRKINGYIIALQMGIISFIVGNRNRIVSVTVPTALPAISHLKYKKLILHRFDKMSAFKGANKSLIESYEKDLLNKADIVLFSSSKLLNDEKELCSRRAVFFDHGVDLELFQRTDKIPDDMKDIPKPILGFFGGLDDHVVDFDLLEYIAKKLPTASLVLVGDAPRDISKLTSYKNVFWLGKKQLVDIPSYGSHFDVALMPFNQSSWLEYANPIKLKEYMSLGLPIVSTPMNELDKYDNVFVADTKDIFIDTIEKILINIESYSSEGYRESQRSLVLNSDWNERTKEYLELIETS